MDNDMEILGATQLRGFVGNYLNEFARLSTFTIDNMCTLLGCSIEAYVDLLLTAIPSPTAPDYIEQWKNICNQIAIPAKELIRLLLFSSQLPAARGNQSPYQYWGCGECLSVTATRIPCNLTGISCPVCGTLDNSYMEISIEEFCRQARINLPI
jgi:hypothetical protein